MSLLFRSRSFQADIFIRQKWMAIVWLTILTFHIGPLSIPLASGLVPTKQTGGYVKSVSQQQQQQQQHHQGSSWGCRSFPRTTTTRGSTTILYDGSLDSVAAIEQPDNQKKSATPTTGSSRNDKTKPKSKQDSLDPKTKNGTTAGEMKRSAYTTTTTKTKDTTKGTLEQQINEMIQKGKRGGNITRAYCDSMLRLCVASKEWDNVLTVMEIMNQQNLTLTRDHSTYQACLQACFEVGRGATAIEILASMEAAKVTSTPSDLALVIGAMCRNEKFESGWWRRALGLIQAFTQQQQQQQDKTPSLVLPVEAYDAVLSCMVRERQWQEAIRFVRQMENTTSILNGNEFGGVHPTPQLSTYRMVIECCLSAGEADQAFQVLNSMTERGMKPTVYAFELVISALSKKLQWRRALQLMDMMDDLAVPKTVVMYNSVISACAKAMDVGMAKSLLVKMRKQGTPPNILSFNAVISACASTSRWNDALAVLDQCYREPGVTPDIYTYTNAIRACAKGGKTDRALTLLQVVKDKKLPIDSYCYTAVIDACAKAGLWRKALDLLAEMQDNGIEATQVTYSVVISACGNGGQWRKALELLQLMRDEGMSVNLITYNAAITALSKASRRNSKNVVKYSRNQPPSGSQDEDMWTRVVMLLQQMKEDGIQPDGFSFTSAISCGGAEGRWEEALELIKVMKKGGPRTRPNKIAYTAAISACGRAGEADSAIELFRSMKSEGLSADGVAYNALFSALRVAGRADMAYELWGEICGTRSTARDAATPDIITVTDCIDTLSRAKYADKVDEVFEEAVKRHIVLGRDTLDSSWDIDLSGMSFPVARAACRYIVRRAQQRAVVEGAVILEDITLVTGVGKAAQHRKPQEDDHEEDHNEAISSSSPRSTSTSLREYAQEVLQTDFDPPIACTIPKLAQGTVVIAKEVFLKWLDQQPKP